MKERVGRVLELALEPAPSRCPARGLPAQSLPSHLLIARSLQTARDPRALKAAGGRPAELDRRETIGSSPSAVRTPTGAYLQRAGAVACKGHQPACATLAPGTCVRTSVRTPPRASLPNTLLTSSWSALRQLSGHVGSSGAACSGTLGSH